MNVLTWHNDTNRTGWQCNETTLTQTSFAGNTSFGLLTQLETTGSVYAQPLVVHNIRPSGCPSVQVLPNGCDVLYVADVQDDIYAFIVGPTNNPNTPLWSTAWQNYPLSSR